MAPRGEKAAVVRQLLRDRMRGSQAQLAAAAGVSTGYVTRLQRGYLQECRTGEWKRSAESWRRGVRRHLREIGLGLCGSSIHHGPVVVSLDKLCAGGAVCKDCRRKYQAAYIRRRSGVQRRKAVLSVPMRSAVCRWFREHGWRWVVTHTGVMAVSTPTADGATRVVFGEPAGLRADGLRAQGHLVFTEGLDQDFAAWATAHGLGDGCKQQSE
jgi:hypothetical protein